MRFVWATAALWAAGAALGQTPTRTPVWFDTELGSDLGDPFALVYLMADPNVELRGLTVVGDDANVRALMASRFLTFTGRRSTPSAAGAEPQPKRPIDPLGAWRY